MFFPCLENLKKERFPEQSIQLFDWWLGTRRQNTLRNLNPLQFSLDCDIDVQHALQIFAQSVYNDKINLLKKSYSLHCPVCNHRIFSYKDHLVRLDYSCRNCGSKVPLSLLEDEVVLSFELLESPKEVSSEADVRNKRGNASSLRMSDVQKYASHDEDIRRLYNDM